MTQLEECGYSHEVAMRDIAFRVNEVSSFVRDFIFQRKPFEAGMWARDCVRIARQLDDFPR